MSAHSAEAYTATLLVMVNVRRGGGLAPPTLTSQGQFYSHHWMYARKQRWQLCVLCGLPNAASECLFWRTKFSFWKFSVKTNFVVITALRIKGNKLCKYRYIYTFLYTKRKKKIKNSNSKESYWNPLQNCEKLFPNTIGPIIRTPITKRPIAQSQKVRNFLSARRTTPEKVM